MMKYLLIAVMLIGVACTETVVESNEQEESMNSEVSVVEELVYDSVLAAEYGADDYGMKQYVMAFLKRGPNRDLDSTKAMELQMAHLKNIERMAEEGKLIVAGPFVHDGDIRGIYVFDVQTVEEAQALTETDPAIQQGSLEMELIPWYSSAALMGVNEVHKTLSKTNPWD